ncbi:hypothetical protein BDR07DRAFT_1608350 [Suillus spraguei]|nr:hypothetical protein BDR07DRAFT_1608350 [Suillus spraguei]
MPILAIEALNGCISSTNTIVIHHQHLPLVQTHPSNMTVVSNDPSWWPFISPNIFYSYWSVAAAVVVVYDWVLTLAQETELIWKQRWSLMTVLYLMTRCIGILYSIIFALLSITSVSLTDTVSILQPSRSHAIIILNRCNIMYYAINVTNVVIPAMLGVIMIARLHAMYQRSRNMLIVLVIIFLAINIACGALTVIGLKPTVGEELVLSGRHMCNYSYGRSTLLLASMVWMLNTIWEALALCLSVWIAAKHFRELRRLGPSTGLTIGDCFRMLIKSHVLYFASFAGVSSLQLVYFSPEVLTSSTSIIAQILVGSIQILLGVQMFVLGPRLILSVREYHAKLVANSDAETSMRSIVFEERKNQRTMLREGPPGDPWHSLISETTFISQNAGGLHNIPRRPCGGTEKGPVLHITEAVHEKGSCIFIQLGAPGRVAETPFLPKRTIMYHIHLPDEIKEYVATYAAAPKSAIRAGFDGVEIHGPNSYLIDQFMQDVNNQRTDKYGRSIDNRATFALEATDAIVEAGGVSESARRICCSIGVGIL